MKIAVVVFLLLSFMPSYAQKEEPSVWQVKPSKMAVKAGEVIELIFTAEIKEGWYLYSSDFDKDLGPVVAEFNFQPNDSYELVGEIKPVGQKSKTDNEIWMGTYTYFTKKAEFRQKVKILKENPLIKVKLNGQVCSDVDGKCIPVIKQFTFEGIKVINKEETDTNPKQDLKTPKNEKNSSQPKKGNGSSSIDLKSEKTIEELKAEKAKLIKKDSSGEDKVVSQLKDFATKYGN